MSKNELSILNNNLIESKIIIIKDKPVIIDRDVAEIYGVETREITQAVGRNKEKFPDDFIFELDKSTLKEDITNSDILESIKFSRVPPKVFTEQGLYMLATILKSKKATETTIQIIRTFAKLKEIQSTLVRANTTNNKKEQEALFKDGSKLLTNLLQNEMEIDKVNTETSVEINLGFFKLSQKTSLFSRKKDNKNIIKNNNKNKN